MAEVRAAADRLRNDIDGHVIWNVNSTSAGGGVAEMLHRLVGYGRDAGLDVRWVVIGGDAGIKFAGMDAQMAGDLVAMAEPVTKWSAMVVDPASTLRMLRRAIKIAATPPMGAVYLCLPQDILDAPLVETVRPTSIPSTRVLPEPAFILKPLTCLRTPTSL